MTTNEQERVEEIRAELRSLGRPSLRLGLRAAVESKREIDAWSALNPDLAHRHAVLIHEEADLERRIAERERCAQLESRLYARLVDAGAGEIYVPFALGPEPERTSDAEARRQARSWLETPGMWALVLSGTTGTGKTIAGVWAMAETLRRGGTVASRTAADIGKLPPFRTVRGRDEFKDICSVSLLLVDELGHSKLTETGHDLLIQVLSKRYESKARTRTIITSNLGLSQLQALLGERILDRLRDGGGRVVDVSGKSMRGQLRQLEIGNQLAGGQAGLSTTETDR